MTCGVPWPRGLLCDLSRLVLLSDDLRPQALQSRALDLWPDGSVRWVLLDWFADTGGGERYRTGVLTKGRLQPPESPLQARVSDDRSLAAVETGCARFEVCTDGAFPFESVEIDGRPAIDPQRSGFVVTDGSDQLYKVSLREVELAEAGPVRVTLCLRGQLVAAGDSVLADLTARMDFFANSATVRFEVTMINPRRAGHPGGRWSLGSDGSIYLRDASLTIALPAGYETTTIRCSPETDSPHLNLTPPVELYQDSSGGENWRSLNHVNRRGRVPNSFRGYRLRHGTGLHEGYRATPTLVLQGEHRYLAVSMRYFWQNFPKALEASRDTIGLRLFPRHYSDLHELQGGEQKTHTFYVAFLPDRVTEKPLAWCCSPLLVHADPEWYAKAGAVPYLLPRSEDPNVAYLKLAEAAIEAHDTFEHKREVIDEYGWRHFGDIYADHEAVFDKGERPLISHYNNQYDAIAGFAVQFMRSGDPRWFQLMDELARHVIDIDIYHTDKDKSTYNHGQFWHTVHYTDAGTSNHRSYPPVEGVCGGGPSTGQLYTTGLMLHHFLTGNPMSREAALELGQYVIDADDGSKTIFRFLDRGYTGHVSESGLDAYNGPGRSPANAINALVDAHRLTHDRSYLDKAEQLIRRCIHPRDDLKDRNLLDAENRWYYTMFLQSLGRYLDHKQELSELDRMYAYGRAALLHYALWAVDHEYPYLDKPEILEYPTETWAAQDLRKSEMFKIAAKYVAGEERQRLLDRARFFFAYSVRTLRGMDTRTLCRPVVLMLSCGYSQAYFDQNANISTPSPVVGGTDFGEPQVFISQKRRVKQKLQRIGLGLLAAVAGLIAVTALLIRG